MQSCFTYQNRQLKIIQKFIFKKATWLCTGNHFWQDMYYYAKLSLCIHAKENKQFIIFIVIQQRF